MESGKAAGEAAADVQARMSGGTEVVRSGRTRRSVMLKPQAWGTVEHQWEKGVRLTPECGLRPES